MSDIIIPAKNDIKKYIKLNIILFIILFISYKKFDNSSICI